MAWTAARIGVPVKVLERELTFSPYMLRAGKRWAVQAMLYAAEPWGLITAPSPKRSGQTLSGMRAYRS